MTITRQSRSSRSNAKSRYCVPPSLRQPTVWLFLAKRNRLRQEDLEAVAVLLALGDSPVRPWDVIRPYRN